MIVKFWSIDADFVQSFGAHSDSVILYELKAKLFILEFWRE